MKQTESQTNSAEYRQTSEYQAATEFMVGRINYERVPKMPYSRRELNLDRMASLLDLVGNPHKRLDVIHLAGTKGKGSTAAFLSSALQEYGLRCGSYTSPHLHHIEERFQLNSQPCSPETFVMLVEQLRPAVASLDAGGPGNHLTYFEIATAVGFLFFLHERVDVAVVEVGLGGRLDSTNICLPLISVITSISFDHTKQLGNTLALIAAEKAGIIKLGVPVVSGVVTEEPQRVIQEIAKQRNATLLERDADFRYAGYRSSGGASSMIDLEEFSDDSWQTVMHNVVLGSPGEHQAANASVAWAALRLLPDALRPDLDAIRRGFESVHCQARIEVVATNPLVIVDAAHNVASARALVETLAEFTQTGCRWLILATTRGKDVRGMLDILLPHFDRVVCTQYQNNPRGHEVDVLVDMTRAANDKLTALEPAKRLEITGCATPRDAWLLVQQESQSSDQICITGSFFIAAELRELLLG